MMLVHHPTRTARELWRLRPELPPVDPADVVLEPSCTAPGFIGPENWRGNVHAACRIEGDIEASLAALEESARLLAGNRGCNVILGYLVDVDLSAGWASLVGSAALMEPSTWSARSRRAPRVVGRSMPSEQLSESAHRAGPRATWTPGDPPAAEGPAVQDGCK